MAKKQMSEEINRHRRRFFGTAAMTIAAAKLGMIGSADAQSSTTKPAQLTAIKRGAPTSFASLKQVDAGVLNVRLRGSGSAHRPSVIPLHRWPQGLPRFGEVGALAAFGGLRVIVAYLRGYGTTRFLSDETFRNGQPSAVAVDTIAFMDA